MYWEILNHTVMLSSKNLKLYNKYESSIYTSVILFVTKVCCVYITECFLGGYYGIWKFLERAAED